MGALRKQVMFEVLQFRLVMYDWPWVCASSKVVRLPGSEDSKIAALKSEEACGRLLRTKVS